MLLSVTDFEVVKAFKLLGGAKFLRLSVAVGEDCVRSGHEDR